MSILKSFVFFFLLLSAATIKAQFKVIGYLRANGNMVADLQKVDLSRVTHLNIAFINPDTNGIFKPMPALDTVVALAHAGNVKVLLSCGGGSRHVYYAKLLSDGWRQQVVDNFIKFADQYKLDGIDVDIEGDDIDNNYENFVVALSKPLHASHKLLTAALAYYTRTRISDMALQQFDFVNLMAYDKTGPWRPSSPGQHSPISYVTDHLNYWGKDRKLSKDKLVVGVPFYGYGFGTLPDSNHLYQSMNYKEIIATFPGAAEKDEINFPNKGGTLYYNGVPTMKKKTILALQKGGGVMIWHLLADTEDSTSLLNTIHQTISNTKNKQ